jgi:hypothetical protein
MHVRLAVVMLSLAVALTGCSVQPPTKAELVGTWVHGDTVLVLLEDGTFTLTDAPDYTLFTVSESWRESAGETRDGFGEWSVEPDAVRLDNQAGSEYYGEKLFFGSEGVLLFGLDMGSDLPRCFELVRKDSDLLPKGPEDCFLSP